jgi:hypothetical protein
MAADREFTPLTMEVTIVPADDTVRTSSVLCTRLSAQPVRNIFDLRLIVDRRITGARARVARAEAELAKQLAAELEGFDEAADDELMKQAEAIRVAVVLPANAEAVIQRLHGDAAALMAALSRAAAAEAAATAAECRMAALAPEGNVSIDIARLRETSRDVVLAEAAARSAQQELGAAAGAVRPEARIALRAAGRRAFDAGARFERVRKETKSLIAAALALTLVAGAAIAAASARAIGWPAAAALSGVLAVVALAALIQRRRAVHPSQLARIDAEAEERRLAQELRAQEEQFGDWGVRVMKSMSADDELRVVLERWQSLAGRDVDPERVEELIEAIVAVDETRSQRQAAVEAADDRTAAWLQTTSELGLSIEPALEPGATLELLDRALAVRAHATECLRDLHETEHRAAARSRLADLLRGRTIRQLDEEAEELTAQAGDDDGGVGPLLYVDDDEVSPDGRIDLLHEAARLGPDGRFVVVTADPGEWAAARMAMPGADDRDAFGEIDLRDGVVAPAIPISEPRPWFAS